MISFSFLFLIISACTKSSDTTELAPAPASSSTVNKTLMLQLVNEVRKRGCQCGDTYYPPAVTITWNEVLEKAAAAHSKDMSQKKYFSHTSPDGSNAGSRIDAAGYKWKTYGENIAMGYSDERAVVDGWISSPGHCKNIMNGAYKEMGVANINGYWTQVFATK